jgi:ferritin-like metal-binding protein YciE
MKTETLQDLYAKELQDLYGSEKLLVKWLAKMSESADQNELRQALANDAADARAQLGRLEKIFQLHGEKPVARGGKSLEGILREAEDDMAEAANPGVRDAVIVAAVQQAKHYEIAAYGTLQAYAIHLGHNDAARFLQTTLQEERAADRKLTAIALNYMRVETGRPAA